MTHLPVCGRQEGSGVIIMVPPAGREEIGISAATSIGTTRLAVDNTVTLTGRGSTMILLGSTKSGSWAVDARLSRQPGYPSPRHRKLKTCRDHIGADA
jgi:hypothetical protein